ncbi:MAG: helix-turn-helix domain-containing protein [Actinomycetia bacterium]|nr:helix-turn-helix domain-containing protein [Actinomycetes bacterium]MCH9734691.1 helix-turn-helix domain-containing protein [Actinomycetes bacterium]
MNAGWHASGSSSASCLLTIDRLAERLTVSVGCIRSWRLKGEGPPAIRVGTALRWDSAEVDAWLDGRRESRLDSE